MPSAAPPPILPISALSVGLDAFVAVRAAVAAGIADSRATFEYSLGAPSDHHGFLVFAGLDPLLDALERFKTKSDELAWLESKGALDAPTRKRLAENRFACDVDAAPEGSIVFPNETNLTVEGPFWQAQLVHGLVIGALAQATLVATTMARLSLAGSGAELIESGTASMYRLGGCPTLARAAFIGGASATTCAIAGKRYGVPVRAMQPAALDLAGAGRAHAMLAWMQAMPRGAILRIDGREALGSAIAAIHDRQREAHGATWEDAPVALEIIDADPDLARQALAAFASANLPEPFLFASGGIDERAIIELRRERAPFGAFAVGDLALPSVAPLARYELVAIEEEGVWEPRMRVGTSAATSCDPARKMVLRFLGADGALIADVAHLANERMMRAKDGRFIDRASGFTRRLAGATSSAPLLANVMRAGKRVASPEPISATRERAQRGLGALASRHKRLVSPVRYPVGMTTALAALKAQLLEGGESGEG